MFHRLQHAEDGIGLDNLGAGRDIRDHRADGGSEQGSAEPEDNARGKDHPHLEKSHECGDAHGNDGCAPHGVHPDHELPAVPPVDHHAGNGGHQDAGRVEAASSPPISAVDPVTARIQNPSAMAYTTSPRTETSWPCQSSRKFRVQRGSPPRCKSRDEPAMSAIMPGRQPVFSASSARTRSLLFQRAQPVEVSANRS